MLVYIGIHHFLRILSILSTISNFIKIVIIVSIVLPGSSTPKDRQSTSIAVNTLSADQTDSGVVCWLEGSDAYSHIVSRPRSVNPS